MDNKDLDDEKIRERRIEYHKLKLEYVKVFLTFCSIIVVIEVFIIGTTSFDPQLKIAGLIVVFVLMIFMGIYFNCQMNEAKMIYLDSSF